MLVVPLVEEKQVTRQGLLPLPGDETGVALHEFQGAGVGGARTVGQAPVVAQGSALFGVEFEFRWQDDPGKAHRLLPFRVVRSQRFGNGKPDQPGAIAVLPARRRALIELRADDAYQPGAEDARLRRVEPDGGLSTAQRRAEAGGDEPMEQQAAAKIDHGVAFSQPSGIGRQCFPIHRLPAAARNRSG